MANRIPRFETHIRPMMRKYDRESMLVHGLDLWNYDVVRANADKILELVSLGSEGDPEAMPPLDASGPWPDEWIALFRRWVGDGHPQLDLGIGDYELVRVSPTHLELTATGPAGEDVSCLEWHPDPAGAFEFILYREPRVHPALLEPETFTLKLSFESLGNETVVVEDAQGRHVVAIATP